MFSNVISRGLSTAVQEVVVMGGGLMGTGIAQVAAQTHHSVTLVDLSQDILNSAQQRIEASVRRVAKKGFKDDTEAGNEFVEKSLGNIKYETEAKQSLETADMVVEAITEVLPLKQKLFKEWDLMCPSKTIFATNTSFLKVGDVMKEVARRDRCGGLHFFNPVPVMKLVEVIKIAETSDDTYDSLMAWSKAIGKHPVTCRDTEGFIVNRLLGPYIGVSSYRDLYNIQFMFGLF